jgi:hypothetical protein
MLKAPLQQGRDARLFPGVTLEFFTLDDELVPVQLGEMVREPKTPRSSSYWRLIPQVGRVWKEPADGGWSRAAFPLMLVSDLENQAQQGLASFLYRDGRVSALTFQFVQQSGPYLLQHFGAVRGSSSNPPAPQGSTRDAAQHAPNLPNVCLQNPGVSSRAQVPPVRSRDSGGLCIQSGGWRLRCSRTVRSTTRTARRPLALIPILWKCASAFDR